MEMKTKTNRRTSKLIIIVSLALVLLTLLGVASYAWIRNYVAIENISLTTGKMSYKITLYKKGADGKVTKGTNPLFDTATTNNNIEKLEAEISNADSVVDVAPGEELFFVIEKKNDSIDLDALLSFEQDGDISAYDYMGQVYFQIKDVSKNVNEALENTAGIDEAINSIAATANNETPKSMNEIWDVVQKTASLDEDNGFACIRVTFSSKVNGQNVNGTNKTFPLKVNFCVFQKGAPLPGKDTGVKNNVSTLENLNTFMDSYDYSDELYITSDIEYIGDLVFTRPCKITLNRATLTVYGNIIFSYAYEGEYTINTVSDGHIEIFKNEGAGGKFQIDLPNGKIDMSGANNEVDGKADVYVEGEFLASASKDADKGIVVRGLRVCDTNENLKTLNINGTTRLSTTNHTELGKIVAKAREGLGYSIVIDNRGKIAQIDLTGMIQDPYFKKSPCILIDNGGTLVDGTIRLPSWSVRFNHDTKNTEDPSDDVYSGNTRIIKNEGAGDMKAIALSDPYFEKGADGNIAYDENGNAIIKWPESSADVPSFISYEDRSDLYGRDDIEYTVRKVFVEFETDAQGNVLKDDDGNPTHAIIHYETPSEKAKLWDNKLENVTNLKSYVDYLYGYSYDKFLSVKVICYGDKVLDEADYAFIREMTSLETLDLSDAVSMTKTVTFYDGVLKKNVTETHRTVPARAFAGMSNLKSVKMPERDTMWETAIFEGTSVDEITFPQALTRLLNARSDSGVTKGLVKSQDVLNGIKYVYTSITKIEGLWADSGVEQYFFTPDKETYDLYRESNVDTVGWYAKIFLMNGSICNEDNQEISVTRHGENGEIFLRYDPNASQDKRFCEFVVQTDGSKAWTDSARDGNLKFNFETIVINGKVYQIVGYDAYALYSKLDNEPKISVKFSNSLKTIGEYAFADNFGLGSVEFGATADTKLLGHTFFNNESLTSVKALSVTTLDGGYNFAKDSNFINAKRDALLTFDMPKLSVVSGAGDLKGCQLLNRVDIGVIELTETNKDFYSTEKNTVKYDDFSYAKFYIHTENAPEKAVLGFDKALAADYRYIFVRSEYADLYRATGTYTGVADIGENSLEAVKEDTVDGIDYYYYVDTNTGKACLVACLAKNIDKGNASYTLVDSLGGHIIDKIGSAAYHFTAIKAKTLNIPDSVTEIGQYAFDARKSAFKKYCVTFNINKVTKAGIGAFYYMDMVKLEGPELLEVSTDTLTNNASLIVAKLPKLVRSQPAGETTDPPRVFVGASSLRIAYTSFSKNIRFDNNASRTKSYIRFINYFGEEKNITIPDVNTVIAGNSVEALQEITTNLTESPCNYINTDINYSDIYYSDWYECSFMFNDAEESILLPGYFYYNYIDDDGIEQTELIAVSPDVSTFKVDGLTGTSTPLFGDWNGANYTTPNNLYWDSVAKKYTSISNGTDAKFAVTKIGKYAYGYTRFSLSGDFIIGDNIKKIDACAFKNCAYSSDGSTLITLNSASSNSNVTLKLSNVTEVATYAFYRAQFNALEASMLKIIGMAGFDRCNRLTVVELPSFEKTSGFYAFRYCSLLEDVILGEHAISISSNTFYDTALKNLTILNKTSVVTAGTLTNKTSAVENIYVYQGLLAAYKAQYPSSYGGVSINKFKTFGNAYVDSNNIVYCWNILDESAKTAYIDSISGDFSKITALTIPSTINGYSIVSVASSGLSSLNGVKELTLPASMTRVAFTAADLANTIDTLKIADSNAFFKTVDGVLYSKDGTTLYAYPKAKENKNADGVDEFVVTANVVKIFDGAFGGTMYLNKLIIKGAPTINNNAFEKVQLLSEIVFESTTPAVFAGWNILSGANVNLVIKVPASALAEYKANVLLDYSILDSFTGI